MDQPDPRTADLGFARVDVDRAARTGDPEVVYGAGKTPAQVMLRWHLQQGRSVIPKSTKPKRIAENIAAANGAWYRVIPYNLDGKRGPASNAMHAT